MKQTSIEKNISEILKSLGEKPQRQGLVKTPKRVEASLRYLTSGYQADLKKIVNSAIFDEEYDEMVLVKDIEIYSLCEHHLLPFYGKCHVAYIPDGKIIGLSKLPRIIDVFARRLQVQERLTHQIADCINDAVRPLGVAVVIEALHLCMTMRGVEKQHSTCVTSTMLGAFRKNRDTRMELMSLLNKR